MPITIPGQYSTYKLLGLDPGLSNTGVAIYELIFGTSEIVSIEAFTLVNDKLDRRVGLDPETTTERMYKLYKLKNALMNVLLYGHPVMVACEAPFFNKLFPMAYGALVEVVNVLHSTTLEYNPNVTFTTISPMSVKKIVGARAIKNDTEKGKFEVKSAVKNIPEIMDVLTNDIDTLSEHAIDAIAVAYTLLKG